MTGKGAAVLTFLLTLAAPSGSPAEHEVYYRYTVLGYVGDDAGKFRPKVEVEVVREKTGFSYLGVTDDTGLYVIVTRLGDESLGERLRLRTGGQSLVITARFDPADHHRERGTRVDFIGSTRLEQPAAFSSTLARFLGQ